MINLFFFLPLKMSLRVSFVREGRGSPVLQVFLVVFPSCPMVDGITRRRGRRRKKRKRKKKKRGKRRRGRTGRTGRGRRGRGRREKRRGRRKGRRRRDKYKIIK